MKIYLLDVPEHDPVAFSLAEYAQKLYVHMGRGGNDDYGEPVFELHVDQWAQRLAAGEYPWVVRTCWPRRPQFTRHGNMILLVEPCGPRAYMTETVNPITYGTNPITAVKVWAKDATAAYNLARPHLPDLPGVDWEGNLLANTALDQFPELA